MSDWEVTSTKKVEYSIIENQKIHSGGSYVKRFEVEWRPESPWIDKANQWARAQGHEMVWVDALGNIVDNPYINRETVKPDGGIFS